MKLLHLKVFLALFSMALSQDDEENCNYCSACARIPEFNGFTGFAEDAFIEEKWPWVVSLGTQPCTKWQHEDVWQQYCGGVIMTDRSVLTAAHCFFEPDSFRLAYKSGEKIRVGGKKGEYWYQTRTYEIDHILWHPKYKKNGPQFDLAIVYTKTKIEFKTTIKPICLPTNVRKVANPEPDTYVNDEVKFAGLGFHYDTQDQEAGDNLREVNFKVLPETECLSSENYETRQGISQHFFCAEKESQLSWTCEGDSGSGLVKINYPAKSWYNSQPYFKLVGVLHGSKSDCVNSNRTEPSMFVNLEQIDNFEFIHRWKFLNSFFEVHNEEFLPTIMRTMTNPNPVDTNGRFLLDVSRQARNVKVSQVCYKYFIDGVKQPGNPFINCEPTKILVATGIDDLSKTAKKVEVMDLVTPSKSCTLSDFPIKLSYAIGAFTPLGPIICSGYNPDLPDTSSRIGHCFALKSNGSNFLQSSVASLNTPRYQASGFVSNLGELIISGGTDNGGNNTNSGEITNFDQENVDGFVLNEKIQGHCSILVNASTAMILGGRDDGLSNVNSTYYLDLNTFQVTDGPTITLPTMQERRSKFGCAVFEHNKDKFVIAAGGWSINGPHPGTEILNLETEIWTTGPQLPIKLANFPLVSTSIGILAVGGYDWTNYSPKNEIFKLQCPEGQDVTACRWITFSQRLQIPRKAHVVVPLPSSYEICDD